MKIREWKLLLLAINFVVVSLSTQLFAQGPPPGEPYRPPGGPAPLSSPPPANPPILAEQQSLAFPISKVGPNIFKIGEIEIHKQTRSAIFPAQLNMNKGLIEYLIVRSSGKVHESLLRTSVEPYHLQIAFLLLGFEGTDQPISHQGAPEKPKGDPVEITFLLGQEGAGAKIVKAEEWVAKKSNGKLKEAGKMDWIFTGSQVSGGQFLAQAGGSIAAIYHDPAALIDNATAGGESDEVWFVKEGAVPPVGTPVKVVIKAK